MGRCYLQTHKYYSYYGERGISVCDEWHDFLTFRDWSFENGYAEGLEIDRINNNGNYEPENVRYVPHSVNQTNKNKAKGKLSKYMGVTLDKQCNRWISYGNLNGKTIVLGRFDSEGDAARRRDVFYDEHHAGNFQRNFALPS